MDRYSEAEMTKIARAEFKRGKLSMIDDEIERIKNIVPFAELDKIRWKELINELINPLQKQRSEIE